MAEAMLIVRACAVSALAALTVLSACGSSSNPAQPAQADARAQFRVMTFNIQHGLNSSGKYDLKWAIDTIAKVNPDLVGVQELTRNHPAYNCDDQPARIAEGLSSSTGRPWTAMYQREWFTPNRECQAGGRGDGAETEGLGFFAPQPLGAPAFTELWNGRIGLMALINQGRQIPVMVTHLAHAAAGHSDRMRQLEALIPWTLNQMGSGPRVLMGDFNHSPGTPEYDRLRASYRDAWEDAVAAGTARGRLDGITHKSSRIDYIFYMPANDLELLWVENVDTRALTGVNASDHNPLVAAFAVKR
jgi:endonuclease/exonuclease/phosphatase family metal-dependent hydrolase